jgi:autotransporter-associated beta strand protein
VAVFFQNRRAKRFAQGRANRNLAVVATAVLATTLPRHDARGAAADNWIWTNAAGDASWGSTANPDNWISGSTGSTTTLPDTGAKPTFADDVIDNKSSYTIAGIAPGGSGPITIPSLVIVPTAVQIGTLAFGDAQTAANQAGALQLSTSFTLGTSASTITLGASTGISRANNNGTISLAATSGTQTIGANIIDGYVGTQTWALSGTGELLISGSVTTTSSQTIAKTAAAELELSPNNSAATFAGTFVAQGGETLLDNGNALGGSGNTNVVQVAGNTANASLLLGPGVTFDQPVATVYSASTPTITVGGSSGANAWQGNITINSGTSSQGIILWGGTSATGLTTISGLISDANPANAANDPVTKADPGTVIITNPSNSFGGAFTDKAGTVVVGANGTPLGTSSVDVQVLAATSTNSAALLTEGGITFNRNVTVYNAGTTSGATAQSATLGQYSVSPGTGTWGGNITLNQPTTLTGGGGTVNFGGNLVDGTTTNFYNSGITVNNGTVVLSGTGSYSGTTTISAGTLALASKGALTGSGAVTVGAAGNFGGSGSVAAAVNVSSGGTLFAGTGNGIGSLTAGNSVALSSGSTLQIKVQAPSGGPTPTEGVDNDLVLLGSSGTFSPGGATLQLLPAVSTFASQTFPVTYVIVDGTANSSPDIDPSTTFANLANNVIYSDGTSTYSVDYSSDEVTLTLDSVPEPASMALFPVATSLILRRRRKS